MTTRSSNTDVYNGNDTAAHFQQWGKTISDHLKAIGLTQTADSGQINWATVAVPGANTVAGYEMYAMADTLDATAPIRIKIEYGIGASVARPNTWVSIGTATDGAGNITGQKVGPLSHDNSNNVTATSSGVTRCCRVDGFVGVACYMGIVTPNGANSQALCRFFVTRMVDDSGLPTTEGFVFGFRTYNGGTPTLYTYNRALNTFTGGTVFHTFVPGPYSASLTDETPANYQAFRTYLLMPKMRPVFGIASTVPAEVAAFSQYSIPLVGTTSRNYINMGNDGFAVSNYGQITNCQLGMLWE
jgi:hypothetical protein